LCEAGRIYKEAREFMKKAGNPLQWPGEYPSEKDAEKDAEKGNCYVCEEAGKILAVFALVPGEEPTYSQIFEGAWKNELPYSTVHRMAVRKKCAGIGRACMDFALEKSGTLRIDTHKDNIPMQKLLEKCGFEYCGIIYLEDGAPRLAYQKTGGDLCL
ncbi:MAG: GNAT family N-acetyltransferase, partial [Firmicutes bacterium]|nr:GNAT family N-acetyltransferase [Bacillota bacterium]